jgi:hypothetical protein
MGWKQNQNDKNQRSHCESFVFDDDYDVHLSIQRMGCFIFIALFNFFFRVSFLFPWFVHRADPHENITVYLYDVTVPWCCFGYVALTAGGNAGGGGGGGARNAAAKTAAGMTAGATAGGGGGGFFKDMGRSLSWCLLCGNRGSQATTGVIFSPLHTQACCNCWMPPSQWFAVYAALTRVFCALTLICCSRFCPPPSQHYVYRSLYLSSTHTSHLYSTPSVFLYSTEP